MDTESFAQDALSHYLETALWTSYDNLDPLDANESDVADECRAASLAKLIEFLNMPGVVDAIERQSIEPSQFGHDFLLTRDHHGAGFWDRGYGDDGYLLTKLAYTFGDSDFCVGDDGLIYSTDVQNS